MCIRDSAGAENALMHPAQQPSVQINRQIGVPIGFAHPEPDGDGFFHGLRVQILGHGVPHAVLPRQADGLALPPVLQQVPGGVFPGPGRLLGHEVHQIVDMQHVAAGEHAGNGGEMCIRDSLENVPI